MENILQKIEDLALSHDYVPPELIKEKNIKLGLRNADGSGVVVGITAKGMVKGYDKISKPDGGYTVKPSDGRLYYCGYDVSDLVRSIQGEDRYGFNEITYLLLAGELPTMSDLEKFDNAIAERRTFTRSERSIIMAEGVNYNQMYALHSVVSHLSRCDRNPDSTDIRHVTTQCLNLIAKMPLIVAYNYNVLRFRKGSDLNIMKPDPDMGSAENFLYLIRGKRPTKQEAMLFDLAIMLHAEHGGGNNSTFTVRTVSSSGANTYMAICAGIASLSGHLHGGANESVMKMMKELKNYVRDWEDEDEIRSYLVKILDKKAGDGSGKIYGMGHAVYTLSDPRAVLFREKAEDYARVHKNLKELYFFDRVAKVAAQIVKERKGIIVSPNVDFYSGLIYKMMGIPMDLYTPIFAMARVVGWSAHRIEQIVQDKIIRPAYVSSLYTDHRDYVPLSERM